MTTMTMDSSTTPPADVFARYSEALDRADLMAMAALVHDAFRLEGAGFDGIGNHAFLAAMKARSSMLYGLQ